MKIAKFLTCISIVLVSHHVRASDVDFLDCTRAVEPGEKSAPIQTYPMANFNISEDGKSLVLRQPRDNGDSFIVSRKTGEYVSMTMPYKARSTGICVKRTEKMKF